MHTFIIASESAAFLAFAAATRALSSSVILISNAGMSRPSDFGDGAVPPLSAALMKGVPTASASATPRTLPVSGLTCDSSFTPSGRLFFAPSTTVVTSPFLLRICRVTAPAAGAAAAAVEPSRRLPLSYHDSTIRTVGAPVAGRAGTTYAGARASTASMDAQAWAGVEGRAQLGPDEPIRGASQLSALALHSCRPDRWS